MLSLAAFNVDFTPPVGCPVSFGTGEPTTAIRDPLWLRGVVIDDGPSRCVIASLDYCGLMNGAQDALVCALAKGAGIGPEHVAVHCIHQHDAPIIAFEIESYLDRETFPKDWWAGLLDAACEAAAGSLDAMAQVAQVGHAETRLHGYASNRRILGPNGKVRDMRYSRCDDEDLKREPVGVIDPMLRTMAFRDSAGSIMATLSFYASHPQVSNGRCVYSADAQGEAMRLVSEKFASDRHAFFSGPGGNVTAGKYSSPTDLEGNLLHFGKLLADGITHNLTAMQWETVNELGWQTVQFPFPAQAIDKSAALAVIGDDGASAQEKLVQAVLLTAHEHAPNASYRCTLLRLGSVRALFLPGELFVEYQLYAQSLMPDQFLAVAATCGESFLYLPLAHSFAEGGYEPTMFCWCTQEFEPQLKAALAEILCE